MGRWGITTEEATLSIAMALGGCRHLRTKPVTLSTGEHVACICVTCYQQLPADWIEDQRRVAWREAHCTHEDEVSLRTFGQLGDTLHCTNCGRTRDT